MSAERTLQAAALAALRAVAGLNGVFLGPPVRATAPFAELGDLIAIDWSTKDLAGREIRLMVTLRDAAEGPGRIETLAAGVVAAIEAIPRDLPGWRLASVVLARLRITGGSPGQWSASVDYRIRMMEAL
ncbi:DUF3168 domain-containing protein [Sphingomonas sp. CARO-RG-8B-R24-01]|uniref:tail completion protein gp17 n=1 Tax=Sphingomonas sp. CARO-RG-8B-R24-01 TaxID=2914831 RepID=UPI001F5A506D|nr:DUF3168 domain-containing protein [Sphingomonas sp. CARO-RG-8B-R24-01]